LLSGSYAALALTAEQQNKQWALVSLISSGTGQTEHRIPPHRQCFNVSGIVKQPDGKPKHLTK